MDPIRRGSVSNTSFRQSVVERAASWTSGYAAVDQDAVDQDAPKEEATPLTVDEEKLKDYDLPHLEDIPTWRQVITLRALLIAIPLGALLSVIMLNLILTNGIAPAFNLTAGLLGFVFLRVWVKMFQVLLRRLVKNPPGRQENCWIETFVVACYLVCYSGGFGKYLTAMDYQTYKNLGEQPGNTEVDVHQPTIPKSVAYNLVTAIGGLCVVLVLRKTFIISYRLPYPTGFASGIMLNNLWTVSGSEKKALKQVKVMGFWLVVSFLWAMFQWFFSAGMSTTGVKCSGFKNFPTFGLEAIKWTWNWDWSLQYIAAGMIAPAVSNYSMLLGAVLSWGIMYPLISKHEGDWYPEGLTGSDPRGLYGYQTFIALSLLLADGLYSIASISYTTIKHVRETRKLRKVALEEEENEGTEEASEVTPTHAPVRPTKKLIADFPEAVEERGLRETVFLQEHMPWWLGPVGYAFFTVAGTIAIPLLYKPIKWYIVLVTYLTAPLLAVINAYTAGLTDVNMANLYNKLGILLFAMWGGPQGGITTGLAMSGIIMASVTASCEIMQDWRAGYLTYTSGISMVIGQVAGALTGTIISPIVYQLYFNAFPIGVAGGPYPAPYADQSRAMALVGAAGLDALPKNTAWFMLALFFFGLLLKVLRDVLPNKWGRFVPLPSSMSLPFFLGAPIAINMSIGSTIVIAWQHTNLAGAQLLIPAVASGLLAGAGIWALPSAIMSISGYNPPVCMAFFAGKS